MVACFGAAALADPSSTRIEIVDIRSTMLSPEIFDLNKWRAKIPLTAESPIMLNP
jgi:hypothetical protein